MLCLRALLQGHFYAHLLQLRSPVWSGLPEANLLLKGGPEAAGGQPPCHIPLLLPPGAGAPEQACQAEGREAGAAFCCQSPWRPHSQQQLPFPPSRRCLKGFCHRWRWWVVPEEAPGLGKSWPLAQPSQSPLPGLPAEFRVQFRPGFARTT